MSPLLSLTGKRWIVSQNSCEGDLHLLCAHLKRHREIDDGDIDWSSFDPSVFPDAEKAAKRVRRAVEAGERVAIFGDYDCDGITGTAQLVRYFRRHNVEPLALLPHRARDGYGLKPWVVDRCRDAGVTLLITIDNGILSGDVIELAAAHGIDTIILDHHHCPSRLPEAYAILHPARSSAPPPHPSAAGIVLRFLHALEETAWPGREEDLALAAVGTIADLVPLKGFNRILVREGLAVMRRGVGGPLGFLIANTCGEGARRTLTSGDVAFRIAPRINAAGRMADPLLALEALLSGGHALQELETLNAERQRETLRCLEHILLGIEQEREDTPPFLCIASEAYPPGIVGLLAGKLTERFGRPTLVASIQGDQCIASLRSPTHYHVTEALERCQDLLQAFGGHAQAAGCSFSVSSFGELKTRLTADAAATLQTDDLVPQLVIDAALDPSLIGLPLCQQLSTLEPFGQANPEPIFLLPQVTTSNLRVVGSEGKHLQLKVGDSGTKAIGFGLGHLQEDLSGTVDLACSLSIDTWNGRAVPQLVVKDARRAD